MDRAMGLRHAGIAALAMMLIAALAGLDKATAVAVGGIGAALSVYLTNAAVKKVKSQTNGG